MNSNAYVKIDQNYVIDKLSIARISFEILKMEIKILKFLC